MNKRFDRLRKRDNQKKESSPVSSVPDLGSKREKANPANIGQIRHLSPEHYGNPVRDSVRKVVREFETLTGRKLDEKFFGLLPDDPPNLSPEEKHEDFERRALEMIRLINSYAGKVVVRRYPSHRGFGIYFQRSPLYKTIHRHLHQFGLTQGSGPQNDGEGGFIFWVRDAKATESFQPKITKFETLYENVTQHGKYHFENLDDLTGYLLNRAAREGIEGSRQELEHALDSFFRERPPVRETFFNIVVGSAEQILVEGKRK